MRLTWSTGALVAFLVVVAVAPVVAPQFWVTLGNYITHVRLSPPNSNDHQHITHVRWQQTSKSGESTKAAMVAFIQEGNTVWVAGPPDAQVGVVNGNPPYLRTHADGQWTNNLLSLPRF